MAYPAEDLKSDFTFGVTDYVVFSFLLLTSAGVGVYFGFFSKAKNTTDEYLMGGKKMQTLPIAISLVASQLSGAAIMAVPAETYSFGLNYLFLALSMITTVPVLCFIVIPVFYENNITNCYEYLQLRFNKLTQQLITGAFILNACLFLPIFMFVPSMAFAQVTGINIHLINAIVSSICIFYTMLGGIKAVVWTDVIQAGIMFTSVIVVAVLGTMKTGGISKVLENASEGGRLDWNFSWDPRARMTVWNAFICGLFMWTGHIGLNQSCVQRIVSLPSLRHAKRSISVSGIGITIIMSLTSFTGIIMFAHYYGCDPTKLGFVEKADKMMPFFVQDIMGHLSGMPGIFISCVFSAALSTMSATLNSLAGVVYFSYIKPHIKHTEERANSIMKVFVVLMGFYCIFAGFAVERFKSILQLMITISGITYGAQSATFFLGMFVPRVNSKGIVIAIPVTLATMAWIILKGQMLFSSGAIKYDPLPNTIDRCDAPNFHHLSSALSSTTTEASPLFSSTMASTDVPRITTAWSSNRDFSIYEVSFIWYKVIGIGLMCMLAIPLSYICKSDENEKLNPKLFAPVARRFLNRPIGEAEAVPLKNPDTNMKHLIPD